MDEKGNAHYTDDFTQIPEMHRSNSKRTENGNPAQSTRKEVEAGEQALKSEGTAPKDRLGRGEDYWRGRVGELKSRITALQEKNENLRSKYNVLTEKYNGTKSSVERANLRSEREQLRSQMDEIKTEIEDTRIILEKRMPEEAEIYKADPAWLK